MSIVTVLKAGTVVDRAQLNKLKADEMNNVLAEAYKDGANVVIIDNVKTFFDDTALFGALETNSPLLPLILEKRGVTVSQEDMFIVQKFIELNDRIKTDLAALVPPLPPYTFATVPDNWSVEKNLKIGTTRIMRKINNSGYGIGIKTLKQVWAHASKYWAGHAVGRHGPSIRVSDYNRTPYVNTNHITIGCQQVERYEIEQLALHLGWDFPETVAAD